MVTHNMRDAIAHGNRLIMMNDGKVVLDIKGEEKKKLTVEKLFHQFEVVSGEEFASDKAILGYKTRKLAISKARKSSVFSFIRKAAGIRRNPLLPAGRKG